MGVGTNLKTILRDKKMTIKQLSELADIPINTLYSITKRDSERVDKVIIQRLAAALGVDPYSLYSFDQASEVLSGRINARERVDAALGKLNDAGMEKAADVVELIAEVPRYKAGQAPSGASHRYHPTPRRAHRGPRGRIGPIRGSPPRRKLQASYQQIKAPGRRPPGSPNRRKP